MRAIRDGWTHYGPASGLPEFREAASAYVNEEHGLRTTAANIVAGPGAKTFEQLFCEAFVNPDDGVLVFSPHFPTYGPNIARRGGRTCLSTLEASRKFRPNLDDIERFLADDPSPKAIFLNSPHNPQWQPKAAHFGQLKTAHFGERAVGRRGRSPVDAHAPRRCGAGGHGATPSRRSSDADRSQC